MPVKAGIKVMARLLPNFVELCYQGKLIARHERCYQRGQEILDLEHYLDVLEHKPGAFLGSKPLQQWRKSGCWTAEFDQLWQALQERLGKQNGSKAMIELLQLGRKYSYQQLQQAISKVLEFGCCDVAAIRHLLTSNELTHQVAELIDVGILSQYQRPLPTITPYNQLLEVSR
ncbi:MAG: hypothetical protein AB1489_33225 [Acidobacteriota bacterium]